MKTLSNGKLKLIDYEQLTIDNNLNDKIINNPLSIINFKKAFTKPSRAARIAKQSESRTSTIGNHASRFDCERWRLIRGAAFTLAEVLITLGVIGVIAAITMPMLVANINERVNSERQANIVYKINQAMEHMRALGKLTVYDSTESFVNELEKHLKIQKRCDKDHLAQCWPTDTVKTSEGEISVYDAKTGGKLFLKTDTNNVGLILADGASIILNYDVQNAKVYDIGDKVEASPMNLPVGNGKTREFAYSSSLMGPVSFVMDVNGKRGPNSEMKGGKYYDIRNFNGARFSKGSLECYNGTCIYYIGSSYSPIDCSNTVGELYSYCGPNPSGLTNDYWAGAIYKCDSIDMTLPDAGKLLSIHSNKSNYPSIADKGGYFRSSGEIDAGNGVAVLFDNRTTAYNGKIYNTQILCTDSN